MKGSLCERVVSRESGVAGSGSHQSPSIISAMNIEDSYAGPAIRCMLAHPSIAIRGADGIHGVPCAGLPRASPTVLAPYKPAPIHVRYIGPL